MVFVLAMTIPFHAIMIPLVNWQTKLHITRSLIGIIPIYWGMYIPFAVFMLHGFVKTIPIELEEAAMLGRKQTYAYIFQNSVSFVEDAGCNGMYFWMPYQYGMIF